MWKNVLLLGYNCPIGAAVANKFTQLGVNVTKLNARQSPFQDGSNSEGKNLFANVNVAKVVHGQENGQHCNDQHFEVIINNVFASLTVQQWMGNESIKQEELMYSDNCRMLNISPFPFKYGETLIPEALPWSSLAFRLFANTFAGREYCRNEEVVAEAVIALLNEHRNGNESGDQMTTVEKVLKNNKNLLQSPNILLKGSLHIKSDYELIDPTLLESRKLLSL